MEPLVFNGTPGPSSWLQELQKSVHEALRPWREGTRPGTPLGDVLLMQRQKAPESERYAAARRIVESMGTRLKNPQARTTLGELARECQKTPEALFHDFLIGALFQAVADANTPQRVRRGQQWMYGVVPILEPDGTVAFAKTARPALIIPSQDIVAGEFPEWLVSKAYKIVEDDLLLEGSPAGGRGEALEGYPDLRALPETVLQEKQLFSILKRALTPQELKLINMLQDDLTGQDIALQLGLSRESVRQRCHRLKKKIKTLLITPF